MRSVGSPPQHRLCTPEQQPDSMAGAPMEMPACGGALCPELPAMPHTTVFPTTHSCRKHMTRGRSLPLRQPLARLRIWGPAGVSIWACLFLRKVCSTDGHRCPSGLQAERPSGCMGRLMPMNQKQSRPTLTSLGHCSPLPWGQAGCQTGAGRSVSGIQKILWEASRNSHFALSEPMEDELPSQEGFLEGTSQEWSPRQPSR